MRMRQQQQQAQQQHQSQGPSWHTPVGGYGANGATPAASSSSGAAPADNSFKIQLPPMGGSGGAQNGNNSAAGHLNSSGGSATQQSSSGETLPPTTNKSPSPSKVAADSRIPSLDDDIQSLMDAIGDDDDDVGISPEGWFKTGKTKDLPDDYPLKIDTDSAATTSKAATSKPLWSPGKEADKKDDSSLSTPEKPPEASEIPKSGKGPAATGTVKINLTKSSGSDSLVSVNLGSISDQADSIKLELGTMADQSEKKGKGRPPGKSKPGPKSKGNKGKMKIEPKVEPASPPPPPAAPGTPEMEGKEDGEEEGGSEEWCPFATTAATCSTAATDAQRSTTCPATFPHSQRSLQMTGFASCAQLPKKWRLIQTRGERRATGNWGNGTGLYAGESCLRCTTFIRRA